MFAASKTAAVSGAAPDSQFNYVTMLLHGDGTNGAQNNTFVDSSTNAFSITRNGNTTQGSFSPYGSNWSNYFGSGNSIYISTSSVFAFTADFTIEAWVFLNNTTTSGGFDPRLINIGGGIDILFVDSTKAVQVKNNGTTVLTSSSSAVSLNTWLHIAIVRNGSTLTAYVNGTSVGSATYSSTFSDTGDARISRLEGSGDGYLDGYISNLRIVKGSAVYTSNFTPSTTPLTAITNTQLLTCQSNRFKDNSSNNFSLTASGTPSVQRFNPFGASTAYSTSVIGGSGYFDGSGDYLNVASATASGSGSFCLEAWIYCTNVSVQQQIIANETSGGMFLGMNVNAANKLGIGRTFVAIDNEVSYTWANNTWYHIAVNRNGTSLQFFVNGTQVGATASNSINYSTSGRQIGSESNGTSPFYGYISDLRCVNASVYTSNFTPPTAPLTAISNTTLLCNMTNGAIFDNAMMNDLETVGNAQISTSVKKYGTGSLYFDGTGDYLKIPSTQNVNFGLGNFTIEFWAYWAGGSFSTYNFAFDSRSGSAPYTDGVGIGANITNGYWYLSFAEQELITSVAATAGWQHIALVRNNGVFTLYINGTSGGTYTASNDMTNTTASIGTYYARSQYYWNGYIDDLRITKGYARYTANFTPPTAAFSNTGPI